MARSMLFTAMPSLTMFPSCDRKRARGGTWIAPIGDKTNASAIKLINLIHVLLPPPQSGAKHTTRRDGMTAKCRVYLL